MEKIYRCTSCGEIWGGIDDGFVATAIASHRRQGHWVIDMARQPPLMHGPNGERCRPVIRSRRRSRRPTWTLRRSTRHTTEETR